MEVFGTIVFIYTLLIVIRILSSWIPGLGWGSSASGRIMRFLRGVTDPYLGFFRRFKMFRLGAFDFSPVVGLIVLSVAGNVFSSLSAFQQVTIGLVLAFFMARLWAAAAFFLNLYIFIVALRLVAHIVRFNTTGQFWRYLDMMLVPILDPVARFIFRGRGVPYLPTGLITGGLFLLMVRVFGALLMERLVVLLQRLPF